MSHFLPIFVLLKITCLVIMFDCNFQVFKNFLAFLINFCPLKMLHLIFLILAFSTNFPLLKVTCLVTLFDRKLQIFKNSPKLIIFGIFHELLSTQNVNVAGFARNIECDFSVDFHTRCYTFIAHNTFNLGI